MNVEMRLVRFYNRTFHTKSIPITIGKIGLNVIEIHTMLRLPVGERVTYEIEVQSFEQQSYKAQGCIVHQVHWNDRSVYGIKLAGGVPERHRIVKTLVEKMRSHVPVFSIADERYNCFHEWSVRPRRPSIELTV